MDYPEYSDQILANMLAQADKRLALIPKHRGRPRYGVVRRYGKITHKGKDHLK
jgi:hypothetical protein